MEYTINYPIMLIAYLLGSIPFGLLLCKISNLGDIRKIGSGNIGATNVLRSGNKKIAAFTLLFDISKALLAVKIAQYYGLGDDKFYAGIACIIGHIFPIWLRFKGGKGVACLLGALLGLSIFSFIIFCSVWTVVFLFSRISALAALSATISVTTYKILFYYIHAKSSANFVMKEFYNNEIFFFLLLPILLIFTHRENLRRIVYNKELSFGSTKDKK